MLKNEISPFRIAVPGDVLSDLRRRVENTRWLCDIEDTKSSAGADFAYLKELLTYWQGTYDWEKQEAALNQLSHFKTDVDGIGISGFRENRGNSGTVVTVT